MWRAFESERKSITSAAGSQASGKVGGRRPVSRRVGNSMTF